MTGAASRSVRATRPRPLAPAVLRVRGDPRLLRDVPATPCSTAQLQGGVPGSKAPVCSVSLRGLRSLEGAPSGSLSVPHMPVGRRWLRLCHGSARCGCRFHALLGTRIHRLSPEQAAWRGDGPGPRRPGFQRFGPSPEWAGPGLDVAQHLGVRRACVWGSQLASPLLPPLETVAMPHAGAAVSCDGHRPHSAPARTPGWPELSQWGPSAPGTEGCTPVPPTLSPTTSCTPRREVPAEHRPDLAPDHRPCLP